jgi:nucleotide-binding universal stress UspA family protein
MYQKILVPVDGSDPSNCGLLEAIKLAKLQNGSIRLLHVVDDHVLEPDYCVGTYAGDVADSFREAGKKVLLQGAALVRQYGLEPEAIAVESLNGNVAALIVEQAKVWGADLIVMGTHARHGLKRLAMGSDAEDVVRHTRISVLLVHDGSANVPETQETTLSAFTSKQTVYT